MEPLTREILRGLKEKRDEEELTKNIDKWVKTIYEFTRYYAERHTETYYKISLEDYPKASAEIMKENMGVILGKLSELFPDSRIYYESRTNLLENLEDFIMIDWS